MISNLNLDPPKQSVKEEKRIKTFSDIQDLKKRSKQQQQQKTTCHTPFLRKLWKDVLPQNKAVNQERERHRTQPKKKKKVQHSKEAKRNPPQNKARGLINPQRIH